MMFAMPSITRIHLWGRRRGLALWRFGKLLNPMVQWQRISITMIINTRGSSWIMFRSYLSFMKVDSHIVQFIRTKEKRAMLGNFVWAYFKRACGDAGCSCIEHHDNTHENALASPTGSSCAYAAAILKSISDTHDNNDDNSAGRDLNMRRYRCKCAIPSLYLQWDGHSVTITGIRKIGGTNGQPTTFNLITFCPMKNGATIKKLLANELSSKNVTTASQSQNKQSKINDKYVKSVIELPVSKLQNKDCQILLSTARIMSDEESRMRKSCTKHIGFHNAGEPARQV